MPDDRGAGRRAGRWVSGRRLAAAGLLAGLAALTLGACERGSGYVEIKIVPSAARTPRLLLDSTRLEPIKDGQTILTATVGTHKLQMEWIGGENTVLCEVVVRKDRITTLTLSVLNRPPRCQCRHSGSDSSRGRTQTCVS